MTNPKKPFRIDMTTVASIIRGDLVGLRIDKDRVFYLRIEDDDECKSLEEAKEKLEEWWGP